MQTEELIPAEAFCRGHQVELSFVRELHDSGLIGITIQEGTAFLPASTLPQLERLVRLRYEMDINLEGLEAISHLLQKLNDIQVELLALQNKLRFFQASPSPTP
jgi:hypothetical protein